MLYIFTISASAILWFLITFIIVGRLVDINNFFKTKYIKRSKEGVSDLLQYESIVEDGIILLKNGSLMSCFSYQGADLTLLTTDEQEYMTKCISRAISDLGSGWAINFDSIRLESQSYPDRSLSSFPNQISFAIDEERRKLFESRGVMFNTNNFISLTYTPPLQLQTKFTEMMYDEVENKIQETIYQKNLNNFKLKIENFLSVLSIVLKLNRLGSVDYIFEDGSNHKHDNFLEFLHYCITGKSQPISLPKTPISIDLLIGGEDLITGVTPKIGDKYISCVAIDGFPPESYPTILGKLADMPVVSRFSSRYICIDRYEAESRLEKIQKKWQQKQRGFISVLLSQPQSEANTNHDAVEMTHDTIEGITLQKSEQATFGYYTANIVLMDEDSDSLKDMSIEIKKMISSLGFNARIEAINCIEAFLGSLPGHLVENVRRFFISSLNLGDLIPKHTVWTGREFSPCNLYPPNSPALLECVTTGNTPYHLNLHVADVGHTLIVGPTGAGKSTLLATLIAQTFRYKDATAFVFDKGMSMFGLTKAMGGKHFELGASIKEGNINFAPFNYIDTDEERQWLVSFVERLLQLNEVKTDHLVISAISNAINTLYEEKKANPSLKHSITDFISQVQNSNIQAVLSLFDVNGAYGGYISALEDNVELSFFTTFEIEKLMNLDDKIKLLVLDYLFRKIDLMLHGQPAFVVVEEAWIAFKNKVFAAHIIEWLKVKRKYNCAVILVTQNLNDLSANTAENLLSELIISTGSNIFLPNPSALKPEFAGIYRKFGLNDQQIKVIADALPKRHYYHYSAEGARLFELCLGRLALTFVAVGLAETKNIKTYISKYKDDWMLRYLSDRHIEINDYLTYYNKGTD